MNGVSIVMPLFKPNPKIMNKIMDSLNNQNFKGKIEILKMDGSIGMVKAVNLGIKKSKYPIIITLHQDCVPESKSWINSLIEPFKDKEVVATVSDVEMPKEIWNNFDIISRVLSVKEQKVITPLMDEKGCAYKKSVLKKLGYFDEENFRTAGEDYDMAIKLLRVGVISYPHTKIIHYHYYTWKKRLRKEFQLSNAFGALVRLYGVKMPKWYFGLIKSIPFLGWPLFLEGSLSKRLKLNGNLTAFPLALIVNFIYFAGFWKGLLIGKQTF
ncbi:MAG: glycosyltransferase [Nanoarchaeota archaeon]